MVESTALTLDKVFHALSDGTRRAILRDIAAQGKNVSEIARPYAMSLAAVSKHLKVLENAGLITREKRGTARIISMNPKMIREARIWLEEHEAFWRSSLDALDAFLRGESQ